MLEKDVMVRAALEEGSGIHIKTEGYESTTDLASIRNFLVSTEAFGKLASAIRRTFYARDWNFMHEIECKIKNEPLSHVHDSPEQASALHLSPKRLITGQDTQKAQFDVLWDVVGFLESQFGSLEASPRLRSLVVITGSAYYAQSTTCSEYLRVTWPKTGNLLLSVLQQNIDCAASRFDDKNTNTFEGSTKGLNLVIRLESQEVGATAPRSKVLIQANGTDKMIVQLAQQLAWIGCALRNSPSKEHMTYCVPTIKRVEYPELSFVIRFQSSLLHSRENPCWLPLFHEASIVRGFPIPERKCETGLEMPLEMMVAVIGARHAVEYGDGVIIKGFSKMLIPTKRAGNIVQWHLISNADDSVRLRYSDVSRLREKRASLSEVNLDCLKSTRAVIGWCGAAISIMGSKVASYATIDHPRLDRANRSLRFSGGSLGFQQFGMAQLDFTLGPKEGKCHFHRGGPYSVIITAAQRTPVVLFDAAEERAWLVSACEVILHICHLRSRLERFEVNGQRVQLPYSSPTGDSAMDALLRCSDLPLFDGEKYTVKELVLDIWSLLESLVDQNVQREQGPGTPVKRELSSIIYGYDFMSVVERRSPLQCLQRDVGKTSAGWLDLVRDIDALVLFAAGFGDVIPPLMTESVNYQLCRRWRTVPIGKDYLATTVHIMKDLYNVAGCRMNHKYLTPTRLQWHRGKSSLFEACVTPGSNECKCFRLQQVLKPFTGSVVVPGPLADDGAIIFGQVQSRLLSSRLGRHQNLEASRSVVESRTSGTSICNSPDAVLLETMSEHREHSDDSASDSLLTEDQRQAHSDSRDSAPTSLTRCSSLEQPADGYVRDLAPRQISLGRGDALLTHL